MNKVLPLNKVCLTKQGAFKPYSRIHILKGRAMATNGRVAVCWNLKKIQQVGKEDQEEQVMTEEVIEYLEGKSVTSQYWESLIKANEVYVVEDGDNRNLEIMQEGRTFVLEYTHPSEKETYAEQISKIIKQEKEIDSTDRACLIWEDLEIARKALGVSNSTKVNMFFNGSSNSIKIIPENGYDCFAVCDVESNETNMFLLDEFNEFIEDFLTVGDTFSVKLGKVETEEKEKPKEEQPENQEEMNFEEETKEEEGDVLDLDSEDEGLPV